MTLPGKSSERDFTAEARQRLPWLPPVVISLSETSYANTSTKISQTRKLSLKTNMADYTHASILS